MRLYLAGPMRGYPGLNHAAFNHGAVALRECGHEVFNPAEHDVQAGIGPDDEARAMEMLRELLGADLAWITGTADGLVMLPGWELALGASAEAATAWALGLPVWEFGPFITSGPDA